MINNNLLCLLFSASVILLSCGNSRLKSYSKTRNTLEQYDMINDSTIKIAGNSHDVTFGFSVEKPIMLGLSNILSGADNIQKYLNALKGKKGGAIQFKRLKPCCPFKTKNLVIKYPSLGYEFSDKYGLLEKYKVTLSNENDTLVHILYFNLYDQTDIILAPNGFAYEK